MSSFVWGQFDPELNKYLWLVIRTQKDRKLQTLMEVCIDFATLGPASNIHRPAEQVFAMEEDDESEDMVAIIARSQWTSPGVSEPTMPPSLQHMFTLVRQMGYEMRPIARHAENTRRPPVPPRAPGQGYRMPFRPGRDNSKIKCFSCGNMGHTQAHCPKPDSALPLRPDGWNVQSDASQQRNNNSPQGHEI